MKVKRRNPAHWLLLGMFFLQSLIALGMRLRKRKPDKNNIILYGHKLNGNLLALQQRMHGQPVSDLRPIFLTMDRIYRDNLKNDGVEACWACGWEGARALAVSAALISDHGLHSLQPLRRLYRKLGMRFFDVWHGIPFKGFDSDDFKVQHAYDEVWVASDLSKEIYINKFGFEERRVHVTGYPRTDRLVRNDCNVATYRKMLGLPEKEKLILFAPTWKQDASGRSIYPFGCTEQEFLEALLGVARDNGAGVVLRSHLNSGDVLQQKHKDLHTLPVNRYPDTEAVLLASDLLICDWSSIAFDYLLLDRPTFFLDVDPPFAKGFTLGPTYRYGVIIKGLAEMVDQLAQVLRQPEIYWQALAARHEALKFQVYTGTADGHASERCIKRLQLHIGSELAIGESSR